MRASTQLKHTTICGCNLTHSHSFNHNLARFGLTVRFAMKACPNAAIVQLLVARGLHIDASSCFEAARAIAAMVPPDHICICAQELHPSFEELVGWVKSCSDYCCSTAGCWDQNASDLVHIEKS